MLDIDGHDVGSASSVLRAMARRDLLQPITYQAERREFAKARRASFIDAPPARRNRLWQADFSTIETATEGSWQLGGVADYVTKLALACPGDRNADGAGSVCCVRRCRSRRRGVARDLVVRRLRRPRDRRDLPGRDRDRQRPRNEVGLGREVVRRPGRTSSTSAHGTGHRTRTG